MILEEKEYADVSSFSIEFDPIGHPENQPYPSEAQTEHALMHVSEGADLDEEMKKLQKVIAQYNKMN